MRPVRLARFLLRSSFIEATLHRKERMATDLLALQSFTLSYTSTHSLIHVLWGVYQRQPLLSAGQPYIWSRCHLTLPCIDFVGEGNNDNMLSM